MPERIARDRWSARVALAFRDQRKGASIPTTHLGTSPSHLGPSRLGASRLGHRVWGRRNSTDIGRARRVLSSHGHSQRGHTNHRAEETPGNGEKREASEGSARSRAFYLRAPPRHYHFNLRIDTAVNAFH